ncbi:B-cell receptor-associated protein 31 isoform X4 [Chrysoperla carnea]|uniref:B-cell receptor-associated protein 31 isoform X4 n=1 Tax=Chrysoperla carnea TaxID=189513 RepID=UPI001D06C2D4|nr:B-cell receptor-associated protein 31 isoform X4 [Chrysoperla carnea]
MSLQWAIIAGFLYVEIAIVLLLVLPVASPKRWSAFFKSRFLQAIGKQAGIYFIVLLAVLVLFLLDAIREMKKYSSPDHSTDGHGHLHLDAEMQGNMRLFRAQRNFYISGFSLFLSLVIRRLILLISTQASLLAQAEASMRQAQNASTAARTLMAQHGEEAQNSSNEAHVKGLITDLEEKLEKEKKNSSALKSQAESLNKEYDRLTSEYSKLQKSITASGGDKKDD